MKTISFVNVVAISGSFVSVEFHNHVPMMAKLSHGART